MATVKRRDFLYLSAAGFGVVGLGSGVLTLFNSMNPAKDVTALASIDVDIASMKPGEQKTVSWRGKPIFIRRRSAADVKALDATPLTSLKDPQTDKERFAQDQEFMVVIGVCTHLGCIPSERDNIASAEGGGWLCACHGSLYDGSGRILKGPAPKNLEVPPYEILDNKTKIHIG